MGAVLLFNFNMFQLYMDIVVISVIIIFFCGMMESTSFGISFLSSCHGQLIISHTHFAIDRTLNCFR